MAVYIFFFAVPFCLLDKMLMNADIIQGDPGQRGAIGEMGQRGVQVRLKRTSSINLAENIIFIVHHQN